MRAAPVPLAQKPSRVWTLLRHTSAEPAPELPFRPSRSTILEDYVHDWHWHKGMFRYYSRVTDKPVWVLLEYEDEAC